MNSSNLPDRKTIRLQNFDYTAGAYFVTIAAFQKCNILSSIVRTDSGADIVYTAFGKIAEENLLKLEARYPYIHIDKYVIMPNHIHVIVMIAEVPSSESLSGIIGAYKSITTRECQKIQPYVKIFQASFHDHILRNMEDYEMHWQYIEDNPVKWITGKHEM